MSGRILVQKRQAYPVPPNRVGLAARGRSPRCTEIGAAPARQCATREQIGAFVTEEHRRQPGQGANRETCDRSANRMQRGFFRGLLGTALLCTLSCGDAQTVSSGATSVVLIVVDTLRADHLGLYGYDRPTSPNLDAWAVDGRVFEYAFAPAPWTLPSFSSLYTGRWPLIHQGGLASEKAPEEGRSPAFLGPAADLPTLAETLRDAGLRTLAVATNPFLAPSFGMARGFDRYDLDLGTRGSSSPRAEEVVRRALALVDEVKGQPFFLVVHLLDPHVSYDAPPPFRHQFTASIQSVFTLPVEDIPDIRRRSRDLATQDRAFVTAAYDEEIAYTDAQLGVLRDGLSARGVLETSLLILTADHGEELFEHGSFEHGHAMWQELLHVPLVMWGPGVAPGRESVPVSLVDIAPTVLDGVGLTSPSPFDGHSLWPTLSAGASPPMRTLFSEGILYRPTPQSAVVHWPHKLIVNHQDGLIEAFDLAQDPHERTNLVGEARATTDTLIAHLCRHQQAAQEIDRATDHLPATHDPAVLERLRALGYVRVDTDVGPRLFDRKFPCYSSIGAGPFVHVRWVATLDDAQRRVHEKTLGLTRGTQHEGSTWRYRVPEVSPDRLRTIVNHEMVEDTNGFDRATLELDAY